MQGKWSSLQLGVVRAALQPNICEWMDGRKEGRKERKERGRKGEGREEGRGLKSRLETLMSEWEAGG